MTSNRNDALRNRKVRILATSTSRRRSPDFPGWGAPDAAAHLLAPEAGLTGRITNIESHGSNPWTRYSVCFDDGSCGSGLMLGHDIELAA